MEENIFDREKLLIGEEGINLLAAKRVALFGVGGVGSYVAEALARAGVGSIDLFDGDVVSLSNINRQIVALGSTVGKSKVMVMGQRIMDINPACQVKTNHSFIDKTNIGDIDFTAYDYVIDAIDTVTTKLLIIEACKAGAVPIICCLGTGNKLHAEQFRIADISKTSMCPLAKVMRRELKARNISGLKVLFSEEPPAKHNPPGSISFVPPVAGMLIAGEAVRDMLGIK